MYVHIKQCDLSRSFFFKFNQTSLTTSTSAATQPHPPTSPPPHPHPHIHALAIISDRVCVCGGGGACVCANELRWASIRPNRYGSTFVRAVALVNGRDAIPNPPPESINGIIHQHSYVICGAGSIGGWRRSLSLSLCNLLNCARGQQYGYVEKCRADGAHCPTFVTQFW